MLIHVKEPKPLCGRQGGCGLTVGQIIRDVQFQIPTQVY